MTSVHFTGAKMASKYQVTICSHQIYLTENQRYDLFACIPVKAVGILIKAEIAKNLNAKNINEIFCNYEIDCKKSKSPMPVEVKSNTIKLHLPFNDEYYDILDEIDFGDKKDEFLDINEILNKDEGGKEFLFYETVSNDTKKRQKFYHKIEIKDIKEFNNSVEFVLLSN
jgi:hypothetical protein